VRKRHAAQQTRRLRHAVMRMQHCLGSLPERQQSYLTLRAGLGLDRPLARAAAAKRVGVSQSRARVFERRALRRLEQVCGSDGSSGATTTYARTSLVATGAGTTAGAGTAQVQPVADRTPGENHVLGAEKSHRQQQGEEAKGKAPSAFPRTTGAVPEPPAGNSPSELWIVAAIAALAALAGASLVRRRAARFNFAVALPPAAAAAAPAAAAAAPVDPSQQVVSDALESLSSGDVERAAALVHPDVRWPDPGNGTIEGRDQFERYWQSRLSTVSIDIEPVSFERRNGELLVEVNEIVRSRATRTMIGEYHALRRFSFRDGLIAEMKHGRA
jgi:ketosteroid isomerase-like protein